MKTSPTELKSQNQNVSVLDILIQKTEQCNPMICVARILIILPQNQKEAHPNASLTVVVYPLFWINYVQILDK